MPRAVLTTHRHGSVSLMTTAAAKGKDLAQPQPSATKTVSAPDAAGAAPAAPPSGHLQGHPAFSSLSMRAQEEPLAASPPTIPPPASSKQHLHRANGSAASASTGAAPHKPLVLVLEKADLLQLTVVSARNNIFCAKVYFEIVIVGGGLDPALSADLGQVIEPAADVRPNATWYLSRLEVVNAAEVIPDSAPGLHIRRCLERAYRWSPGRVHTCMLVVYGMPRRALLCLHTRLRNLLCDMPRETCFRSAFPRKTCVLVGATCYCRYSSRAPSTK